jgi:hypothetical protein
MSLRLNYSAKFFGAAVLASTLGIGGATTSAYAISEQEAQDIAVEAYVYFYPLVTMDVMRKQLTNDTRGRGRAGIGEPRSTKRIAITLSTTACPDCLQAVR